MSLVNEFNSTKNKGTLWTLMYENGLFDGIESKYVNNVKNDFEKKISQISLNISQVDNLTILNKQVISDMMNNILKYKNIDSSLQSQTKLQTQPPPLITSTEITEQRQKVFNNILQTKKNEFDSMMNKNIPNKIDFSDVPDKPIGSEMDKILAETIAWREKQLNVVLETQDKKEASTWINRDQDNDNKNKVHPTKNITIGQSTTLDNKNIIDLKKYNTEKRVNFNFIESTQSDDFTNTDNFISMLKKKTDNNVNVDVGVEVDNSIANMTSSSSSSSSNLLMNTNFEEIKSMLTEIIKNQKIIISCISKETSF